jgi:hypothetical protein
MVVLKIVENNCCKVSLVDATYKLNVQSNCHRGIPADKLFRCGCRFRLFGDFGDCCLCFLGLQPMTLTCKAYRASVLPTGDIQLEIEAPLADAIEDKLTLGEAAAELRQSVKTIDRLSRRNRDPLPVHRRQWPALCPAQRTQLLAHPRLHFDSDAGGLAPHGGKHCGRGCSTRFNYMRKFFALLFIVATTAAHAASLSWDRVPASPPDPNLYQWVSYTVYWGTLPRVYTRSIEVGATTLPISALGLEPGGLYFITVTATYHSCWSPTGCDRLESAPVEQILWVQPASAPAPKGTPTFPQPPPRGAWLHQPPPFSF